MLKNNYDVAMIMQRRKIHAGLSIYVPALGIEGKYSEDEGIFYALDGTSYEVLDEFIYDLKKILMINIKIKRIWKRH